MFIPGFQTLLVPTEMSVVLFTYSLIRWCFSVNNNHNVDSFRLYSIQGEFVNNWFVETFNNFKPLLLLMVIIEKKCLYSSKQSIKNVCIGISAKISGNSIKIIN